MAEQQRISHCPNCGAPVVYRLGRAECLQCGFTGDDAFSKSMPQPERQGFQNWQHSQPGIAPPPGAPGSYSGQLYSPPSAPAYEDPLRSEKWAFIGAHIVALFITLFVALSSYASTGMTGGSALGGEFGGMLYGLGAVVGILVAGVRFAIFYFVFFAAEIWAKWTCLGCNGCALLAMLPVLFLGSSLTDPSGLGAPSTMELYGQHPWLAVLDISLAAWLIYLLYRDIQNRQSLV